MRQTSLSAYDSLNLQDRERFVLAALNVLGSATNFELAAFLKWPINCVTGRTFTLVKRGMVEEAGKEVNPQTGKQNTVWRIRRRAAEQMELFPSLKTF